MRKTVTILLCIFSSLIPLMGQSKSLSRKTGEIIVQLDKHVTIDEPLAVSSLGLKWEKALSVGWQIHLYSFDESLVSADAVLDALDRDAGVVQAQLNYRTEDRAVPNDPEYFRQSSMSLIKAPEAWEYTTGGLTGQGDTIVIAILEKGYFRDHPDYQANRWYNRNETPKNGIDDDGNGFVDDYLGFDARNLGDGFGTQSNHGTAVTGIAGAQGNNGVGVSGVNWRVKLMNLSHVEYENEIIEAYNYVFEMRKRYNQSGGTRGAYVVASNASFGIDNEKAKDHKIWCSLYDSLGNVGVLSVGATTNANSNVDVVGDMPTSCTSPYLITVTNVNTLDVKQAAGYGVESIDIGAPGAGTITTAYQGGIANYDTFGGTSASAPHVTGAIGLIYSLPCGLLTLESLTEPTVVAERVRDLILQNLDDNASLKGLTKYESRLNLVKPLVKAKRLYCEGGTGELMVEMIYVDAGQEIYLTGSLLNNTEHLFRITNSLGQIVFEKVVKSTNGQISEVISARDLMAGAYFASLSKGKKVKAKKFLKF
jgi:subtilisin family serine protease